MRLGVRLTIATLAACLAASTAQAQSAVTASSAEAAGEDLVLEHPEWVRSVAISPDSALLATIAGRQTRIYDARTGKLLRTLDASKAYYAAFAPDGKLATVSSGEVALWNPRSGEQLAFLFGDDEEDQNFSDPSFLPGSLLAVEGGLLFGDGAEYPTYVLDGDLKLVRSVIKTEREPHHHEAAQVSPDGRWLAVAGANGVEIWDFRSGNSVRVLKAPESSTGVAYSPDSRLLAATGGAIQIYDAASGRSLRTFGEGASESSAPAFSRDGSRLVTGHENGEVRVWEVATGREIYRLSAHRGAANSIALSPDGRLIASGGEDGAVKLWDAASGKPLKRPGAAPRPASPTAAPGAPLPPPTRAAEPQTDQAAAAALNQQILARDNEIKAANDKAAAEAAARQEAYRKAMADYQAAKARNDADVAASEAARRKFEADKAAADAARARYEADKAAADAAQARYEAEMRAYEQTRGR